MIDGKHLGLVKAAIAALSQNQVYKEDILYALKCLNEAAEKEEEKEQEKEEVVTANQG